jgi:hypothetical protein
LQYKNYRIPTGSKVIRQPSEIRSGIFSLLEIVLDDANRSDNFLNVAAIGLSFNMTFNLMPDMER